MRALILGMMEAGLGDNDVLVTHTGCQFPCNQAPVVSVQPDDVWYGDVDPDTARAIVARAPRGRDARREPPPPPLNRPLVEQGRA